VTFPKYWLQTYFIYKNLPGFKIYSTADISIIQSEPRGNCPIESTSIECVRVWACMRVYVRACVRVRACARVCACVSVYACVCVYAYVRSC